MLKQIFNIKKLFQGHKPEAHVSMTTVHGTRCILHVANLALFGVVIMLTIASALIYYLLPVTDVSELSNMVEVQEAETNLDAESVDVDSKKEDVVKNEDFSIISERNMFSNERKEWVVKAVIPKASELERKKQAKKFLAKKKALAGKPKKIVLHGIVMSGDIKKALINNPSTGVSKKKTLYIEEGDELEGYKVTSIEKDRIKLDWHGEEIVVPLYSGLKGFKQGSSAGKLKRGGFTKLDYKYKIDQDAQAEESFGVGGTEYKKVADADILEETSFFSMYKEPEHFFMPALDDAPLSGLAEKQEVAEIIPDIKSNDVYSSEEEQRIVKADIPKSTDLATEGRLKQEALSGKPTKIVLYGIVIVPARDIKKAIVNLPMSDLLNNRTLYVEEGDGLEGYKVTSIEPDRLRLDWHGEEMVVKFPPL